jgi:flagellar export protein FliJ
MKRFRFHLESVKTVRNLGEQRAREIFAAELRNLVTADAFLREARAWRESLADATGGARTQIFRSGEQTAAIEALATAVVAEKNAEKRRDLADAALAEARTRWLGCRRELEVIHRIEARAREQHRDEAEKAEQAILDEHATLNHARQAVLV